MKRTSIVAACAAVVASIAMSAFGQALDLNTADLKPLISGLKSTASHLPSAVSETFRDPGDPIRCYQIAYDGPFTSQEAALLCEGGNAQTAECALKAYEGPFTADQAVALCRGNRSTLPAECGIAAYNGPFTQDQSVALCQFRPRDETAECGIQAYHNGPFTQPQAVELCRSGGSLKNYQCGLEAYKGPLTTDQSVALCRVPIKKRRR